MESRCHAVRLRLPGAGDAAGTWVEDLPAAGSPASARRRAVELSRPAAGVRSLLLRYADGPADLVVVADLAVLDRPALLEHARALAARPGSAAGVIGHGTGAAADPDPAAGTRPWVGTGPGAGSGPGAGVRDGRSGAVAPPAWGSGGGDGTVCFRLDVSRAPGAEAGWVAALAATLCGYDPQTPDPVLGTDRGPVRVDTAGRTLGGLAAEPADGPVLAGLIVADDVLDGEYVPCLAPPYPLTVSVLRRPDGVTLRADARSGYVAGPVAEQFLRHLVHVHRQVVAAPDTPVEEAELLDAAERDRVAGLGRSAVPPQRTPRTLLAAFAAVAGATPDSPALTDGPTTLTYRQLAERSDRVAGGLRALGVRPGDRVGVCLQRSAELVVVLLGVLKAGAAYVPADPAYPSERLAHTVGDAGLGVVVTRLAGFPGGAVTVAPDGLAGPPPEVRTTPDDPAYVVYTSGSTGRPKGVVVPHRAVAALLDATRDEYALRPGEVWTLFHSSAFDFSVWEIWGCLLTGGRLVVVPYEVSRDPERFRDLLVAERVDVLSQTPSAFSALLAVPHDAVGARLVVFGGEPLDTRMLLPWLDRHPRARLVNMFGITETTVHVTAQTVDRGLALAGSRSVGPPLPGWHVSVRDGRGRLLPPGVAGEVCVGGAGVADGYLGRPELTAQRFVRDPDGSGRLYRSGDLGRLRPDGALEHLGRIDSQVKIRGFRIELEEIRSVLLEDPAVRAAAVLVRGDDPADPAAARIDAYVVTAASPAAIRRRAAGVLPDFMVPATVTPLAALPLTPNGKLDADRLPAPHRAWPGLAAGRVDGDGDLLEQLRALWTELLGVLVGLDDDFFTLGGNSLHAVRISAAMRERGLPPLRMRELYRYPTVRAVAAALATWDDDLSRLREDTG